MSAPCSNDYHIDNITWTDTLQRVVSNAIIVKHLCVQLNYRNFQQFLWRPFLQRVALKFEHPVYLQLRDVAVNLAACLLQLINCLRRPFSTGTLLL
jgi:hypothetical protein